MVLLDVFSYGAFFLWFWCWLNGLSWGGIESLVDWLGEVPVEYIGEPIL